MTTTKTARKRRSPDSPKPTKSANDREFSVVPVENFQGVSRGKVSQFLGAARALLDAKDGTRDTVSCGPGTDTARIDKTDTVTGCETILR